MQEVKCQKREVQQLVRCEKEAMNGRTVAVSKEETVDINIPAPEFKVGPFRVGIRTCYGLKCLGEDITTLTLDVGTMSVRFAKLEKESKFTLSYAG